MPCNNTFSAGEDAGEGGGDVHSPNLNFFSNFFIIVSDNLFQKITIPNHNLQYNKVIFAITRGEGRMVLDFQLKPPPIIILFTFYHQGSSLKLWVGAPILHIVVLPVGRSVCLTVCLYSS